MQELDDIALLRQYTEQNSEEAFAALVSRHVNKVYSVALRNTRNPHSAEEITQAVFVLLANKAATLGRKVVLSGWLYQTARLTAVTYIRGEMRRARREQEALMQNSPDESAADLWRHIAPLLDDALAGLGEADRYAVVLRYFDGKSLREVGAALGGSEDAAKMRVNRAVEKLRSFFAKRGLVTSTAVLTALISANAVQAAPLGLASSVTTTALAGTSATTINLLAATTTIAMTTLQKTIIATTIAATVSIPLVWVGFSKRKPPVDIDPAIQWAVDAGWSNVARQHPSAAMPGSKKESGKNGQTKTNEPVNIDDDLRNKIQEAVKAGIRAGTLTPEEGKAKVDWLNTEKK